ncbi:type II secretion system minor pseudopilin GspK [Marimonas arenosa]|uniref:Type II secretion system protein K n=1 Tax=Marimonas arenosa TaxID=1795305 RepID=A0AAE4B6K3_9RHOB|nr:type II secretion system minor pseudopilin GspK [Marimonas arenosa]MDQ2092212.1 type II secretion system minor pseudopilin GspK [Marimonas arenosa]
MKGARGFVLVNALVLVAALAAVAVFMLGRAETARFRAGAALEAAQLKLNLDAFEALAREVLEQDAGTGLPADHPGEAWARAVPPVALERGQVTGRIADLQGRFNLNRLANPEDVFARESFDRLALRLGMSRQRVDDIVEFLSPGGPRIANDYARAQPPLRPVGGAALMREQLRQIPGLSERDYARLAPHVAMLPGRTTINVNTVSGEVLASLFPNANAAAMEALVQSARRQPFQAVDGFITELLRVMPEEDVAALPEGLLGVGSTWFEVEITAELDGRVAMRRAVIRRLPLPQPALVAYRLDEWN